MTATFDFDLLKLMTFMMLETWRQTF